MKIGCWLLPFLVLHCASEASGSVWPSRVHQWRDRFASEDPTVRLQTLRAVSRAPTPAAAALLSAALEDNDVRVRRVAAEVATLHGYALGERVVSWLGSDDAELRLAAARLLGSSPVQSAAAALRKALLDKATPIRRSAAIALAKLDGNDATSALLFALSDTDDDLRQWVTRQLARRRDPRIDGALRGKLVDPAAAVRADAALGLAARGAMNDVAQVVPLLSDRSEQVRLAAVSVLNDLSQERTISLLVPLVADDQSTAVVESATRALAKGDAERVAAMVLGQWRLLQSQRARNAVEAAVRGNPRLAAATSRLCHARLAIDEAGECLGFCGEGGCDIVSVLQLAQSHSISTEAALKACGRAAVAEGLEWVVRQYRADDPLRQQLVIEASERILERTPNGPAFDTLRTWLIELEPVSEDYRRVVRLIGYSRAIRAKELLVAVALDPSSSPRLVVTALNALGRLGAPAFDERLLGLLNHPAYDVALAVAHQFYSTRAQVDPLLLLGLADRDRRRRALRFIVLASLLATTNVETIWSHIELLLPQWHGGDRDAILEGLARNSSPAARALLHRIAQNAEVADRRKIAEVGGATRASLSLLEQLATDSNGWVRANAMWSMGQFGDQAQWNRLVLGLKDAVIEVRSNATIALGRVAARERASLGSFVCDGLEQADPVEQVAKLVALRLSGERCAGRPEVRLLLNASRDAVRASAAAQVYATRRDEDRLALQLCREFDPSAEVRGFCEGAFDTSVNENGASQRLVFIAHAGARDPVPELAYSVQWSNGLVRFGLTDRRGAFCVLDPSLVGERTRAQFEGATLMR